MATELKLKEILAAVDLNEKTVWDSLTDDEKKSVVFFTLNRYISAVRDSREMSEYYLIVGNERFNKNLFSVMSKHPKLTWQLACSCGHESKQIFDHEWIGLKRQKNKKEDFLADLFPNMKRDDVAALSAITTDKEIKDYCEKLGWDKKAINGIKL